MKLQSIVFVALGVLVSMASSSAFASYTCYTNSGDSRVFTGTAWDQNTAMQIAGRACDLGGHTVKSLCYSNISCEVDGYYPGHGHGGGYPQRNLWFCETNSGDSRVFTAYSPDRNQAQQQAARACDLGGHTVKSACYGNVSCYLQ